MCKKLAITLLLVFGAVAFIRSDRGRQLITKLKNKHWNCSSQVCTEDREIGQLEREISRIRASLKNVSRNDDGDIHTAAVKGQQRDKIMKRIQPLEAEAKAKKDEVLALRAELKDAAGLVKIGNKEFPVDEVKQRLERVFYSYKRDVEELSSLRTKMAELDKTIDAIHNVLASRKNERHNLEISLLKLETEVFRLRREQMEQASVSVSKNQYTTIHTQINQLKDRIDLFGRKQNLKAKYFGSPTTQPVAKKSATDLLQEIDNHFGKTEKVVKGQ
jgi:chromosome segregation ATPase